METYWLPCEEKFLAQRSIKKFMPTTFSDRKGYIIIDFLENCLKIDATQRMHFLHDMFQMTAIALVSVMNNHISELHLFWDNLYISSSCSAISTDIPGPHSSPLPIVHCFRQVFRTSSSIGTGLLYVGSSWSSCGPLYIYIYIYTCVCARACMCVYVCVCVWALN